MVARWALALAFLAGPLGCAEQVVPPELIHVWRTDLPAYRDRSFEVRADLIVFGTGGQSSVSHRIEAVEVEETENGGLLCVLHYSGPDGGPLAAGWRAGPRVMDRGRGAQSSRSLAVRAAGGGADRSAGGA